MSAIPSSLPSRQSSTQLTTEKLREKIKSIRDLQEIRTLGQSLGKQYGKWTTACTFFDMPFEFVFQNIQTLKIYIAFAVAIDTIPSNDPLGPHVRSKCVERFLYDFMRHPEHARRFDQFALLTHPEIAFSPEETELVKNLEWQRIRVLMKGEGIHSKDARQVIRELTPLQTNEHTLSSLLEYLCSSVNFTTSLPYFCSLLKLISAYVSQYREIMSLINKKSEHEDLRLTHLDGHPQLQDLTRCSETLEACKKAILEGLKYPLEEGKEWIRNLFQRIEDDNDLKFLFPLTRYTKPLTYFLVETHDPREFCRETMDSYIYPHPSRNFGRPSWYLVPNSAEAPYLVSSNERIDPAVEELRRLFNDLFRKRFSPKEEIRHIEAKLQE